MRNSKKKQFASGFATCIHEMNNTMQLIITIGQQVCALVDDTETPLPEKEEAIKKVIGSMNSAVVRSSATRNDFLSMAAGQFDKVVLVEGSDKLIDIPATLATCKVNPLTRRIR